jgi:hypothetical protein
VQVQGKGLADPGALQEIGGNDGRRFAFKLSRERKRGKGGKRARRGRRRKRGMSKE